MEREVGGGIGMGNTCKPMAVSFQCMTKFTTKKKKKKKDNVIRRTHHLKGFQDKLQILLKYSAEKLSTFVSQIKAPSFMG